MKLTFTTLGCPDWNLDTIIAQASACGFNGVDFRGYNGQMNIWMSPEFSTRSEETREQLLAAGLEVSCFSSGVNLVAVQKQPEFLEEIRQYAKLCVQFGTRYIRVFGGKIGALERQEAVEAAIRHLRPMADIAKEHGAVILIETHDDWTRREEMSLLMEGTDPESVGVLWDVHHTYRQGGEQPEQTWETLGSRIAYTHWKDSEPAEGTRHGFRYTFMGEGDVPLEHIYSVLQSKGYSGWFALEWEKRWHPDLPEPELAFPQYVRYMKQLAGSSDS